MSTTLPIDARTSPRSLLLHPPMSDRELEEFCRENEIARIERTREGVILMNPPAGSYSSDGNSEVGEQLRRWWKTHRRGRVYDSSSGFYLPDGSLLSPDAAYLSAETLRKLTREERRGFPRVCPDFVIELLSETDRLSEANQKMERWIENGAQLAWLIDPYRRLVQVYRPASVASLVSAGQIQGEGSVEGFTLELAEVWDCYQL